MRTTTRRIDYLENRIGITAAKLPCTAVVVSGPCWELALRNETYVEILRESGYLPNGLFFGTVDLFGISDRLSAEDLKRLLRKNGAGLLRSPSGRHNDQRKNPLRRSSMIGRMTRLERTGITPDHWWAATGALPRRASAFSASRHSTMAGKLPLN